MAWLLLGLAVVAEAGGTVFLKESRGLTRLWPALGMLACYGVTLALLAPVVERLPIGVVYAVWAGLGVVCVALIGVVFFRERLPAAGWVGVALILLGVVMLNLNTPKSE